VFIYVLPLEIQCLYMYCHWRSSVYICVAIGDPVFIYVLPLEIQCLYMCCHWRSSVYICVAIGDPVIKRRGLGSRSGHSSHFQVGDYKS
jgi:hypothetical protein